MQDSDYVRELKGRATLPPQTKALLGSHSYDSAFVLFRELMVTGADHEIIELSMSPKIRLYRLVALSTFAYLRPAVIYAKSNREQDALSLYAKYGDLLRPHIQQGEWLSVPGIDGTDVPVLNDLFCPTPDSKQGQRCILDFLKSVDIDGLRSGIKTKKFLEAYPSKDITNDELRLRSYLQVWDWDGAGQLPVVPNDFTADQKPAWNYATGVILRRAAENTNKAQACRSLINRAITQFRLVSGTSKYFAAPAKAQLQGIEEIKDEICQRATESSSTSN